MYSTPKDLCKQKFTEFVGHKDEVNCISFSSDFSFVVTGSDDQRVRIFNVKSKQCVFRLNGHEGAVKSVAVSPCDQYFASASFDKTARIWKTADGNCLHVLKGHMKSVEVVAFSSYSVYLCTGSWDRTAILWCVQTGCHIRTFSGHGSVVQSVAFSIKQELLASGSWDFTVRVWTLDHIKNMKIVDTYMKSKKHNKNNDAAGVMEADAAENNSKNIEENEPKRKENDITHSGRTSNNDETKENMGDHVKKYEEIYVNKSEEKKTQESNIKDLDDNKGDSSNKKDVLSSEGKFASNKKCNEKCAEGFDNLNDNRDWKIETAATVNSFTADVDNFKVLAGHTGNVHAVAFSKIGMLASGSWDRSVRMWNPLKGNCLRILLGHTGWVQAVSFSPDSTYCASVADDDSVRVWDIVTGECINNLEACTYVAHHCAFTSKGHLIASGASIPPAEGQDKKADKDRTQINQELLKAMLCL